MKKVFLINSFTYGGGERQASYLVKNKFFDHVFTILPENSYGISSDDFKVVGGKVYGLSQMTKLLMLPIIAKRILGRIEGPFEFISFLEISNFVNVLSKIFRPKNKCIISLRTIPSMQFRGLGGAVNKLLIRFLYPRADLIVSNSLGGKRDLVKNFGIKESKIIVIPNAYDVNEIRSKGNESLGVKNDKFFEDHEVLIMSGRFTYGKCQIELLNIFKILLKEKPKLKLVLLGEGDLMTGCISECRRLGLNYQLEREEKFDFDIDNQVYFLGFRKNPYAYIKKAKLFILNSMWEGYPNVIAESIVLGTVVVSSDCPSGPREIIELNEAERCGVLLETFTPHISDSERDVLIQSWAKEIMSILESDIAEKFQVLMQKRADSLISDAVLSRWSNEVFILRK